jgi:membrane-associated phospholipid phosphatase
VPAAPASDPAAKRLTDHPAARFVLLLAAGALVLVALPAIDRWTWIHVRMDGVYNKDWGRLFRVAGFAPTWLLGALILGLARSGRAVRDGWRRVLLPSGLLVAAIAVAGAIGEVVKLVVRRGRPGAADAAYTYLPWEGHWSTGAIGFPSTHAIVAFAAAFALARIAPRTGPVWLAIAAGCALTRLLDGKHFFSDVLAAAVLAWGTVALLGDIMTPGPGGAAG